MSLTINLLQAMPPKRKVIEHQGSDEEIDVVNIDDTCERATSAMDEIARTATKQLGILTANTRKSSRRVANAGPNSTDVILTSTPKGNLTAPSIKKKIQKNEPSAAIAKYGEVKLTKETRGAMNLNNLQEEVLKNAESAQNSPPTVKAMQEQLSGKELADRGYAVRTLEHLQRSTRQSQIDQFPWNNNLEARMLGTIRSAPEPFSACRAAREQSAAKELAARGCAVRVLDALSKFSQGLDQPSQDTGSRNQAEVVDMNMKLAAIDLTVPRHNLNPVDMRSKLQINQLPRIVSASEFLIYRRRINTLHNRRILDKPGMFIQLDRFERRKGQLTLVPTTTTVLD
ncbi:hypothetical protein QAD02_021893 [Eretmocerus hayati]|uniref:Uncharacterized protein n=1 Tax=Eretmocerus hayati TaxID=131215 RepID=A0ACC2PRZ7_9HYME|nr:hypothetical protein QAD02_021893 [Eretmocerus hayati]